VLEPNGPRLRVPTWERLPDVVRRYFELDPHRDGEAFIGLFSDDATGLDERQPITGRTRSAPGVRGPRRRTATRRRSSIFDQTLEQNGAGMRDTGTEVSRENIELVSRLYEALASEGSARDFDRRLTDEALGHFLDPGVEWVPVAHSLQAVESYRGFDGVRRFWGEFVSTWESYKVEVLSFYDVGDQVAVVVHIVGRTHELEVDETRSSLLTLRDGRVVHVQSFADPEGAREAAGLPP
jgi:ketosteroid isomerase-like protein